MSPNDRLVGNEATNRDRLGCSRGYCGRLVSTFVTRMAEADRRSRITSRLASRRIARCHKARATYRAAIAIRIAAYAVILGLLGLFAWRVEATQERIARERELRERIERRQPEIDTQSRIVWADMCGIVGESRGY
jgi:hypothetical protein